MATNKRITIWTLGAATIIVLSILTLFAAAWIVTVKAAIDVLGW